MNRVNTADRSVVYQDGPGDAHVLDRLMEIDRRDRKARMKCQAAIQRTQAMDHELRRPQADMLREGVYEPRVRVGWHRVKGLT